MRTIRAVFRAGHVEFLEAVTLPENTPLTIAVFESDDLPASGIAQLAEAGGSFDFLKDPAEDIYNSSDGEAI